MTLGFKREVVVWQHDQLLIERYQDFGRGWPRSRKIWA